MKQALFYCQETYKATVAQMKGVGKTGGTTTPQES